MMNLAQSNSFVTTAIGGHNRKMSSHFYFFSAIPTVHDVMLCSIGSAMPDRETTK
jgi:hypothetical protein